MAERRPLATPFANSPDADPDLIRDFVKHDAQEANVGPDRQQPSGRVVPVSEARPTADSRTTESRQVPLSRPKKRRMNCIQPVAPVPVTVRLRPEVAGGLKRASLERQLSGEEMFTQQDLVETLLEPWLRDQGYMD
jgi:hypothetical protein